MDAPEQVTVSKAKVSFAGKVIVAIEHNYEQVNIVFDTSIVAKIENAATIPSDSGVKIFKKLKTLVLQDGSNNNFKHDKSADDIFHELEQLICSLLSATAQIQTWKCFKKQANWKFLWYIVEQV